MCSTLQICTEMPTPRFENPLDIELATQEHTAIPDPDSSARPLLEIGFENHKWWTPGQVLRIRFLDTEKTIRDKIREYAEEWIQYAHLQFQFVDSGTSEIRISTVPDGRSWSHVGRDALRIVQSQPTMNFGWLSTTTSKTEFRQVVLHEFGHALGAVHEHQLPTANIPWDEPKVYEYYKKNYGWDTDYVDANIFAKYNTNQVNGSEYDPHSIMHYAVPNEITIGNFEIKWRTELSNRDKALVAARYPKSN